MDRPSESPHYGNPSPPFWFIGDEGFLVKMVYLEVSWGADMALDSTPGHPRITQLVSGSLRRIWFLVCLAKDPCMERPPEGAPEGLRGVTWKVVENFPWVCEPT